jgi:hypothetical protein
VGISPRSRQGLPAELGGSTTATALSAPSVTYARPLGATAIAFGASVRRPI